METNDNDGMINRNWVGWQELTNSYTAQFLGLAHTCSVCTS
jgi:hypothetical protein